MLTVGENGGEKVGVALDHVEQARVHLRSVSASDQWQAQSDRPKWHEVVRTNMSVDGKTKALI